MKVRAYGKINLSLYITGIRGELHTLDSVMATVSVCDELDVRPSAAISVACAGVDREQNIAYRAAALVEEASGLKLAIDIKKGIPMGGGLGGSSADGAAVLFCAAALLQSAGRSAPDLRALASRLGSDVYFMIRGGVCRVTGTGDEIEPLEAAPVIDALLVDCGAVSTPACYRAFDSLGVGAPVRNGELIAALKSGGRLDGELLQNDLLPAARLLQPRIAAAEALICARGARPRLTGSGGCLFVMDAPPALAADLTAHGFACRAVRYAPRGVEVIEE